MSKPIPTEIKLHKKLRMLEVTFNDGTHFELPCEYLRVFSPSAEVQGHSPDQAVLQADKENVNIDSIDPVGNYAVRLNFDDGHNTGLYSWGILYQLGVHQTENWKRYLADLEAAGHKREKH